MEVIDRRVGIPSAFFFPTMGREARECDSNAAARARAKPGGWGVCPGPGGDGTRLRI